MPEPVRIPKAQTFALMDYHVHSQEVADAHNCEEPEIVVAAPARTSKSYFAAADTVPGGLPDYYRAKNGALKLLRGKLSWSVGPDYGTNKEFQYWWEYLIEKKLLEGLGARIEKAHNSPNQGNMVIVGEWGRGPDGRTVRSIWEGKSATNERALQGEEVDQWLSSEAAEHDERIWKKYGQTRSKRALFPTTPKVRAHWLWKKLQDAELEGSGIRAFTFTPNANPLYDWDRFWRHHAQVERTVAGSVLTPKGGHECLIYDAGQVVVNPECRAAEDAEFAEQFLGQWTFHQGRILPFVWEPMRGASACHVTTEDPKWLPEGRFFWAFDYGYDHPYVGGLWGVSPGGQLYLHESFYESRLSDPEVAERVREANERLAANHGARPERYSGDPRRPEVEKMLTRELGEAVFPTDKRAQSDRAAGHRQLVNLMRVDPRTGEPGILVHARNEKIIDEWRNLRVRPGHHTNEWGTGALEGDDHGFDMAKYAVFVARYMKPRKRDRDWYHTEYRRIIRDAKRKASRFENRPTNAMGAWGTA